MIIKLFIINVVILFASEFSNINMLLKNFENHANLPKLILDTSCIDTQNIPVEYHFESKNDKYGKKSLNFFFKKIIDSKFSNNIVFDFSEICLIITDGILFQKEYNYLFENVFRQLITTDFTQIIINETTKYLLNFSEKIKDFISSPQIFQFPDTFMNNLNKIIDDLENKKLSLFDVENIESILRIFDEISVLSVLLSQDFLCDTQLFHINLLKSLIRVIEYFIANFNLLIKENNNILELKNRPESLNKKFIEIIFSNSLCIDLITRFSSKKLIVYHLFDHLHTDFVELIRKLDNVNVDIYNSFRIEYSIHGMITFGYLNSILNFCKSLKSTYYITFKSLCKKRKNLNYITISRFNPNDLLEIVYSRDIIRKSCQTKNQKDNIYRIYNEFHNILCPKRYFYKAINGFIIKGFEKVRRTSCNDIFFEKRFKNNLKRKTRFITVEYETKNDDVSITKNICPSIVKDLLIYGSLKRIVIDVTVPIQAIIIDDFIFCQINCNQEKYFKRNYFDNMINSDTFIIDEETKNSNKMFIPTDSNNETSNLDHKIENRSFRQKNDENTILYQEKQNLISKKSLINVYSIKMYKIIKMHFKTNKSFYLDYNRLFILKNLCLNDNTYAEFYICSKIFCFANLIVCLKSIIRNMYIVKFRKCSIVTDHQNTEIPIYNQNGEIEFDGCIFTQPMIFSGIIYNIEFNFCQIKSNILLKNLIILNMICIKCCSGIINFDGLIIKSEETINTDKKFEMIKSDKISIINYSLSQKLQFYDSSTKIELEKCDLDVIFDFNVQNLIIKSCSGRIHLSHSKFKIGSILINEQSFLEIRQIYDKYSLKFFNVLFEEKPEILAMKIHGYPLVIKNCSYRFLENLKYSEVQIVDFSNELPKENDSENKK